MLTEIRALRLPIPRSANINGSRGGRYKVPVSPERLYKQRYRTTVYFYDRYLSADGETPTSKNTDNLWKILADALGKAYGLDDRWIDWDTRLVKCDSDDEPYCVVNVERL